MNRLLNKDLDLLSAIRRNEEKDRAKTKRLLIYLFPAFLLKFFLLIFGILRLTGFFTQLEMNRLQKSIAEITASEQYQAAAENELKITTLNTYHSNLQLVRDAADSFPELTQNLFDAIETAAGGSAVVNQMSYQNSTGVLLLIGSTSDARETANFVERLRNTGLFSGITYTGYQSGRSESGYQFDIQCALPKAVNTDEQ